MYYGSAHFRCANDGPAASFPCAGRGFFVSETAVCAHVVRPRSQFLTNKREKDTRYRQFEKGNEAEVNCGQPRTTTQVRLG